MTDQASQVLRSIDGFRMQEWPVNRGKDNTVRKLIQAEAVAQKRRIICGFCNKRSPLLPGPAAKTWWDAHTCHGRSAA